MTQPIRYIDIFAGCGGLSLGLHQAGLKGLFAVEQSTDAFHTLKHNLIDTKPHFDWPTWLAMENWDIDSLLESQAISLMKLRGSVDLIVGGPPCQGFSLTGLRRESDKRNKLIHSYLKFVEIIQPRAIVFENVQGFTVKFSKSESDNELAYSKVVIQKLFDLGYTDARGEMIDLSKYGVPQQRKRFIVVATREGLSNRIFSLLAYAKNDFLATRGLGKINNTSSALSDLEYKHGVVECPDSQRFVSGISGSPENNFQNYLRIKSQLSYVPDSHRFVNHTSEAKRTFEFMLKNAPRNRRIQGDERLFYGIKKRNVTVLDPDQPSLTITTIPDDFIHYCEPRVMTVRECARLQTFPDWFEFKGPYTTGGERRKHQTPRYTQVGNAVPPLFAEQLGHVIKRVLEHD
jgi:DNA (cytosine-5)-methyltransferase 1